MVQNHRRVVISGSFLNDLITIETIRQSDMDSPRKCLQKIPTKVVIFPKFQISSFRTFRDVPRSPGDLLDSPVMIFMNLYD